MILGTFGSYEAYPPLPPPTPAVGSYLGGLNEIKQLLHNGLGEQFPLYQEQLRLWFSEYRPEEELKFKLKPLLTDHKLIQLHNDYLKGILESTRTIRQNRQLTTDINDLSSILSHHHQDFPFITLESFTAQDHLFQQSQASFIDQVAAEFEFGHHHQQQESIQIQLDDQQQRRQQDQDEADDDGAEDELDHDLIVEWGANAKAKRLKLKRRRQQQQCNQLLPKRRRKLLITKSEFYEILLQRIKQNQKRKHEAVEVAELSSDESDAVQDSGRGGEIMVTAAAAEPEIGKNANATRKDTPEEKEQIHSVAAEALATTIAEVSVRDLQVAEEVVPVPDEKESSTVVAMEIDQVPEIIVESIANEDKELDPPAITDKVIMASTTTSQPGMEPPEQQQVIVFAEEKDENYPDSTSHCQTRSSSSSSSSSTTSEDEDDDVEGLEDQLMMMNEIDGNDYEQNRPSRSRQRQQKEKPLYAAAADFRRQLNVESSDSSTAADPPEEDDDVQAFPKLSTTPFKYIEELLQSSHPNRNHYLEVIPNVTHVSAHLPKYLEKDPHLSYYFEKRKGPDQPFLTSNASVYGKLLHSIWQYGLVNMQKRAMDLIVKSIENSVKSIVAALIKRRKALSSFDSPGIGHGFGSAEELPNPYRSFGSLNGPQVTTLLHLPSHFLSDEEKERKAVFQTALLSNQAKYMSQVGATELFETIQVNKHLVPTSKLRVELIEKLLVRMKGYHQAPIDENNDRNVNNNNNNNGKGWENHEFSESSEEEGELYPVCSY